MRNQGQVIEYLICLRVSKIEAQLGRTKISIDGRNAIKFHGNLIHLQLQLLLPEDQLAGCGHQALSVSTHCPLHMDALQLSQEGTVIEHYRVVLLE
jgi:uncharacterized protein YxjI